jgi:adenosine deaminase
MRYDQVFNRTEVPEEVKAWIAAMPKVELHVHLEGATSAEFIFKMAMRNHVALPVQSAEEWQAYYAFRDFNHFIDVYMLAVTCMLTPQDLVDMVVDFCERQARDHILYTEAFFSSALHHGKMPPTEMATALAEGARIGEDRDGVRVRFIPDISRELCRQMDLQRFGLEFALTAMNAGIGLGLGLGGKEIGNPPELYREIFQEARACGLRVVAHGGETAGPESVRGAIEALHAERIGHGLSILQDPGLVALARERGIPLEVSPQSNYCTRVVALDAPHPIRSMVAAGLCCTVNTDDPAMFSTDLTNEYITLAAQGFSMDELWALNCNALQASFLEDAEKQRLADRFNAYYSMQSKRE